MDKSQAGKLGYEKTKHILDERRETKSRATLEKYEADPKFCLFCGQKISFERRRAKFCNSSCSASFNNTGRNRHLNRIKLRPVEFCSCGNTKNRQNKYCTKCAQKHVYQRISTTEQAKTDRSRKRIVIEEKGYQCSVCGITSWMAEPIKLELDHIDGNADNNQINNLRLLCPNCHSQTDTYKSANMGKNSVRQQMRRKRYAEGKTY
ncbi:MAG: HNH endonuclease [Anaerolineae bacterium]|nr:HNH endonuclease [Anaerolineae bacterium]